MATFVLGGVGAIIGGAYGGPKGAMLGWSIGSTIGSLIDEANAPKPEIGKISDLRFSGSAYGASIPRVWGKTRVGGNIIWAAEDANGNHLVEHKKSSGGGKGLGGGGSTTYWYSSTFAVAVCEGTIFLPDATNALGGTFIKRNVQLKKIWADDVLVYDSSATKNIVTPVWHDGDENQSPDSTIVARSGVSSSHVPAYRGLAYFVLVDMDLSKFSNRIPNFSVEVQTDAVTVADVCSDLWRSCGLLSGDIDVTAGTDAVTGIVALQREPIQSTTQQIVTAFPYDVVEVDGKTKLAARGGSIAATVTTDDYGATSALSASVQDKLTARRKLTLELPGRVDLTYFDLDNAHQQATATEMRQSADVNNISTVNLTMSLTSTQARAIAARILDTAWNETFEYDFRLPPKFSKLSPADCITLPTAAGSLRARVLSMTMGPIGELRMTATPDSVATLTQSNPGSGAGGAPPPFDVYPSTFLAWSGFEWRDQDLSQPGFYVAATGADPGWIGGTVWYSLDGGSTYSEGPFISGRSVFGTMDAALATGSPGDRDTFTNTYTPNVHVNGILESTTDANVLAGHNQAMVGNEIIGFVNVSLLGAGQYQLSRLRRGERNSSMSGHASGERFVQLTSDVVRVNVAESFVGSVVKVKVVSVYEDITAVTAQNVTIVAKTGSIAQNIVAAAGQPNGYATLDGSAKLTAAQEPTHMATTDTTQTITGNKTFSGTVNLSAMSVGSILFAGSSGLVSQDNSNLNWDDSNNILSLGNTVQNRKLTLYVVAANDHQYYGMGINSGSFRFQLPDGSASWDFYTGVSSSASSQRFKIGGGGIIEGGSNYFTSGMRTRLDLSGSGAFPASDFLFPSGGFFRAGEVGVAGTNDVFFQAVPATTAGYGYLEAFNSAGLIVGTGNNNSPVIFKVNRTEVGRFTSTQMLSVVDVVASTKKFWGGTEYNTGSGYRVSLDLAAYNFGAGFAGARFGFPAGGGFAPIECSVIGTNDIFFQGQPATTAGWTILECWNGAGMALGTGNNNSPVSLRVNRTEVASFGASLATIATAVKVNKGFTPGVVALTDAATIATDVSLGNVFRVTLGGNRTLGNPTNPTDGQKCVWEMIQDATGSRTITLGSAFALGTDISAVTLTTTASKRDFMTAVYNSGTSKWYVIDFKKGY